MTTGTHLHEFLKQIKTEETEFIDLWLTDIQGNLKTISVTPRQLVVTDDQQGIAPRSFDGSSVAGMAGIADSDLMAYPDSYRFMRFSSKLNVVALFTEIRDWKGLSYPQGDWRFQLKTRLAYIERTLNYQLKISVELEFYLFQAHQQDAFVPLDAKGYFDLATINIQQEVLTAIIFEAEQVGISISRAHHGVAFSQYEIELKADEPLRMADNVIALRHIIRTQARKYDLTATFMPKPDMEHEGSGMHLRLAVFKAGENTLYQADNKTLTSRRQKRRGWFVPTQPRIDADHQPMD